MAVRWGARAQKAAWQSRSADALPHTGQKSAHKRAHTLAHTHAHTRTGRRAHLPRQQVADGLHDRPLLHAARRRARQQRCVQKVGARGHHHHLVLAVGCGTAGAHGAGRALAERQSEHSGSRAGDRRGCTGQAGQAAGSQGEGGFAAACGGRRRSRTSKGALPVQVLQKGDRAPARPQHHHPRLALGRRRLRRRRALCA